MSPTQMDTADSISSQDPHNEQPKKTKSRRPPNTAFRQQRLKAWQPILTPKTVLPIFFIVGIIFAPIGGLLLYASSQVQEIALDYTECVKNSPQVEAIVDSNKADNTEDMPSKRVSASFRSPMTTRPKWGHYTDNYTWPSGATTKRNVCVLVFTPPNDIPAPILFYYRLTNFYQNHRRYVKSFDANQLKGDAVSAADIKSGDCDPLTVAPDGRPYYPCGLIANSMFNDTYDNLTMLNAQDSGSDVKNYTFSKEGIMWSSEGDLYGESKYSPKDVVPPPYWVERFPNGSYDSLDKLPNLHTDGAFQVWMRTAGLPTFSKLAQRNDHDKLNGTTSYRLLIGDHFPAHLYGGTKSILISTRTVMGGKNIFLGIAYVVVGGLCVLLGTVFTLTHLVKPRKLGDHTYLSWNNEPSTATTTGRAHPGDGA